MWEVVWLIEAKLHSHPPGHFRPHPLELPTAKYICPNCPYQIVKFSALQDEQYAAQGGSSRPRVVHVDHVVSIRRDWEGAR